MSDPLWYKDAVVYQLHVKTFCDADGNGIGDLEGLTSKLDYLKELGVTALWLLPFYPSPLRDDGYDIADYGAVHPSYGTLRDFKVFLAEARRRGLKVITELVINHTSDQHPWFQRARRAPKGSPHRDFYVWSDSPDRYKEARIIFKDFETSNWAWDPVAKAYYWHRFYSHQPDLNFEHPPVRRAVLQALEFWMKLGVDGMRLDAIPYLYEREGTNCENLPETHAFLKELRRHLDKRFKGRMLLAEANQWPEDAVSYFGDQDECHMAFHFPVMPRLFMALRMEDRYPILDLMEQTPPIPESCQWAVFLRNHDELTLEMVTDEERDYMYRAYAHDPQARINLGIRRRLAPLLGNNRRRIELMNGLLFSLPGTPIVYYGDEIGMGDNIYLGDRNGVRTPMQWSADRNAGFSRANPQQLYLPIIIDPEFHYEAVNVEAQQNNPHSLLWWTRRLISLRRRFKAFGRGTLEFLQPENRKVLAFLRRHGDETLLVVANLSRFSQFVELDLGAFKGCVPTELFGSVAFPPIGELPYLLTLSPHAFYWFRLEPAKAEPETAARPRLELSGPWTELVTGPGRERLSAMLPRWLAGRRWFAGKGRRIRELVVEDAVFVRPEACLAILHVDYTDGDPERYLLPLGHAEGARAEGLLREHPAAVLAELGGGGVLFDAAWDPGLGEALLEGMRRRRSFKGLGGRLTGASTKDLAALLDGAEPRPAVLGAEQSNTSLAYGQKLLLKLFRKLEDGSSPELELARHFAGSPAKVSVPALAGALEYRPARGEPWSVGILQAFVPNEGDAWKHALDHLGHFLERAAARPAPPQDSQASPVSRAALKPPPPADEEFGPYLANAELMGRRLAELHQALAAGRGPAFEPEPFTSHYQRGLYQSVRSLAARSLAGLRKRLKDLPAEARPGAERLLASEAAVRARLKVLLGRRLGALRTRVHGDFHLGQALFTGKDYVFIDFEGEPARPLGERRLKRSPLLDAAGLLRSYDYASQVALREHLARGGVAAERRPALEAWARFWSDWTGAAFLRSYFAALGPSGLLPASPEDRTALLDVLLLEKALYELAYELSTRPDWVPVPVSGLLRLLEKPA